MFLRSFVAAVQLDNRSDIFAPRITDKRRLTEHVLRNNPRRHAAILARRLQWRAMRFVRPWLALITAVALAASACAGDDDPGDQPAETPTLSITNETPCVVHVRFDNGPPLFRVSPGATHEYSDAALSRYRWIKVESTQAIFHTYDMAPVRADGYRLVVKPAYQDDPCVEM